jgi:hypothetical protein
MTGDKVRSVIMAMSGTPQLDSSLFSVELKHRRESSARSAMFIADGAKED